MISLLIIAILLVIFSIILAKIIRFIVYIGKVLVVLAASIGIPVLAGATAESMLLASGSRNAEATVYVLSGLLFLVIFGLTGSRFLWRTRGPDTRREPADNPSGPAQPVPERMASHAAHAESLGAAWARADMIAPRDARLGQARSTCEALLRAAADDSSDPAKLDMAVLEWAVVIRRNVPDLIDQTFDLWSHAERAEKAALANDLVSDLARLADRASSMLEDRRAGARARLSLTRAHIANRIRDGL